MLLKMVLNNLSNEETLFWSDKQAETVKRGDLCYYDEITNMLNNGVVMFMNDRINVYERPREYEGREDYDNTARCIEIAIELDDIDDLDEIGVCDYFEDNIYDIEYTIGGDLDYVGARIMIAFGGPNIFVNTNNKRVELYWGFSRAEAALSDRAVEVIDAYFEDEYNMRRECL